MRPNRLYEKFINNQGVTMQIIEYHSAINCTVKFEDGTILYNRAYRDIKNKTTRNPNFPTIYSVGYIGAGKYASYSNRKNSKIYEIWHDMIRRCYDPKSRTKNPTYKSCTVVKEWYDFQSFAKWCEENYVQDYNLDKDILNKGNKVYGPDTCCFVPREINNLLIKPTKRKNICIGVYKIRGKYIAQLNINNKNSRLGKFDTYEAAFDCYKRHKEERIKYIIEQYKDKININVYNALFNYKVEMTD